MDENFKFSQNKLDRIFTYQKPTDEMVEHMKAMRGKAKELAEYIVANCPDEIETCEALTKLEQVIMYANASFCRKWPEN
jgi:hypothetical protein